VRRVADRISILRDGQMRGTFPARGISEDEVLSLIIGRSVDHERRDGGGRTAGEAE
jgi:ribose transport system ATP-binding protein